MKELLSLLIISSTLLSGCSHTIEKTIANNVDKYQEDNPQKKESQNADYKGLMQGLSNTCKNSNSNIPCPYKKEQEYLKNWPPKLGLALSGGGTRAASFSIGVLKGLKETGMLDKVDLISSVSGGSYANYWYFSQIFYKYRLFDFCSKTKNSVSDFCKKQLFSNENDIFLTHEEMNTNLDDPNKYRFQRTLEESSQILTQAHKPSFWGDFRAGAQYTVETFFQILSIPVHWIANGLFDWEINMTPYFYFYKDGLDRTYGYVPLDYTLEHFANARSLAIPIVDNIDAVPISFTEIANFLKESKENKEKHPYFVINTTARYGNALSPYGKNDEGKDNQRNLERSAFEFTPWGCYSALLKNNECPKDFHFAVSQRSWGTNELDFSRVVAMSGAAVDGQMQFVDIAGQQEDSYSIFGKKVYEIGLDVLNLNLGYQVENKPFEENLIHKMLPWPLYLLDDLRLDNDATSLYFSDGGHSENLGMFALIQRGVKNIIVVDSEYDPEAVFESAKRLNKNLNEYGLELNLHSTDNCQLSSVSSIKNIPLNCAVLSGNIREKGNSVSENLIKITYIKLSAPERESADYKFLQYSVRSYMEQHSDFPHDSTADVFFDADQFRAYRSLGYTITKRYFGAKEGDRLK